MERIFQTNTLRGRLRTFIINLILFVVLIISLFLMFMTKSQIKVTYQNELNSIVKMQNQAIEKWFNERELDIQFLVNTSIVKNNNFKEIKKIFENFVNNQSEFYFISYVNKKGYSQIDTISNNKRYFFEYDFFKESLSGLSTISDAIINQKDNMRIIHFSSPVLDEYGEVKAVVIGAVRLSSIQTIIEDFRFGKSGETFILNDKNEVLTKRRFETNNKLSNDTNNIKNGFYKGYNNKEVLGSFIKTNFDRWTIVAQVTKDEIYKVFQEFLLYVILFIVFLLILIIPLILKFSNKIEQPLQYLLQGSRQIQNGDYGHEIDSKLIIYATNEIKDLTDSFNNMSNVLKNVILELTQQSTIDMLSKLYNRRELFRLSQISLENAKSLNYNPSVLMIDIDHFKKINDKYGHRSGDIAIESISNTIKTSITNSDIAGRYGGEEFMIFIEDTSYEKVNNIALRILSNVEKLIIKNEKQTFNCTCSIGISLLENLQKNTSLESLIEKADNALYQAKNSGRNKIVFYNFLSK